MRVLGGSAQPIYIIGGESGVYAPSYIPPTAITANYTLSEDDNNQILEVSGITTITFPDGLTDGFQVMIVNIGIATVTLVATTTLTTKGGLVLLADQYGGASAYHAGSNVWRAFGGLS